LGIKAIQAGYPVLFDTATGWVRRLSEAHALGRLPDELHRLRHVALVVAVAVLAATVLIALVLIDGQPASAGLLLSGFALGAVFLKAEFSFTASWRRFITRGQADGLLAALVLIAIAATVIVPVAALVPGFGGAIAPLGPSLIIGAFVFGIDCRRARLCMQN
jgi:hypothetical protein